MKSLTLTTAAFILLTALFAGTIPAAANPSALASEANIYLMPRPAKIVNLAFTTSTGARVSLSDFRGKVVLLHFWSIQCPACRIAEPALQALKQTYGASGLEILGVNLVDPPAMVSSHVSQHRPPFPVLVDGGTGLSLRSMSLNGKPTAFLVTPAREAVLEVPGFPTTYIIDCRGDVVGYSVGAAQWNQRVAVDFLRGLLSQTRSCGVAQAGPVRATKF